MPDVTRKEFQDLLDSHVKLYYDVLKLVQVFEELADALKEEEEHPNHNTFYTELNRCKSEIEEVSRNLQETH